MVWHFSSKQDSDKLDLLNKRILRFIFKDFNSEYNNLLKKAGTANLKDKRLQKWNGPDVGKQNCSLVEVGLNNIIIFT